jgi:hypothetical protein
VEKCLDALVHARDPIRAPNTRPETERVTFSPAKLTEIVLLKLRPFVFAGIENAHRARSPTKPFDVGRSGLPAILEEHETVPLLTGAPVSALIAVSRRVNGLPARGLAGWAEKLFTSSDRAV